MIWTQYVDILRTVLHTTLILTVIHSDSVSVALYSPLLFLLLSHSTVWFYCPSWCRRHHRWHGWWWWRWLCLHGIWGQQKGVTVWVSCPVLMQLQHSCALFQSLHSGLVTWDTSLHSVYFTALSMNSAGYFLQMFSVYGKGGLDTYSTFIKQSEHFYLTCQLLPSQP